MRIFSDTKIEPSILLVVEGDDYHCDFTQNNPPVICETRSAKDSFSHRVHNHNHENFDDDFPHHRNNQCHRDYNHEAFETQNNDNANVPQSQKHRHVQHNYFFFFEN